MHVKELGARLTQELISGLCISPGFAFCPYEEVKEDPAESMMALTAAIQESQKSSFPKRLKKRSETVVISPK